MYKCIISESKMRRKGTKKMGYTQIFFILFLIQAEDLYVRRGSLLREIGGR